jgi:hypothetical protein
MINHILLEETAQIQQDLRLLQLTIERLQVRVNDLASTIQKEERTPFRDFADLEGIWEGLDLSFEQIKAAEYRLPDDLI